jgi:hypothetical protein
MITKISYKKNNLDDYGLNRLWRFFSGKCFRFLKIDIFKNVKNRFPFLLFGKFLLLKNTTIIILLFFNPFIIIKYILLNIRDFFSKNIKENGTN